MIFDFLYSTKFKTLGTTGTQLALNLDNSELFFYGMKKSVNNGIMWRLVLSVANYEWVTQIFNDIDYFTPFLSQNRILIGGAAGSPNAALNILFQWGQTTPVWTLRQNCPSSNAWYLRSSATLEVGNILYFAWAINANFKFLFSGHYASNATIIGNKYLASVSGMNRVTDMTLVNGIIYIALLRSLGNSLLFIYDSTTDTWGQTYELPTTYTTFFTLVDTNL